MTGSVAGTRLPDATINSKFERVPGPGWTAWATAAKGSYMLVHLPEGKRAWWFVDPNGEVGTIDYVAVGETPPPNKTHGVGIEENDGSLTIEKTIQTAPHGFRGTIKKGAWVFS